MDLKIERESLDTLANTTEMAITNFNFLRIFKTL